MADYLPASRRIERGIETPLTLTQLQILVGGFIHFIELTSGDLLVVNEAAPELAPINLTASTFAGRDIYGDVVLCSPKDIA